MKRTISLLTITAASILGVFWVFDRSEVLDYGPEGAVRIVPADVEPDGQAKICFDQLKWKKICPSAFNYYIIDSEKRRTDYEPHAITLPPFLPDGPIAKCRPWKVPTLPAGDAIMMAWSTSNCAPWGGYWPIKTIVPTIRFKVHG